MAGFQPSVSFDQYHRYNPFLSVCFSFALYFFVHWS